MNSEEGAVLGREGVTDSTSIEEFQLEEEEEELELAIEALALQDALIP